MVPLRTDTRQRSNYQNAHVAMSHLSQAHSHELPRLELAFHPPWSQVALAPAALVHGEIGGNALRDINLCPDAQDTHRRRVRRDGKRAHAAQDCGHLLLRLRRRRGGEPICGRCNNLHDGYIWLISRPFCAESFCCYRTAKTTLYATLAELWVKCRGRE